MNAPATPAEVAPQPGTALSVAQRAALALGAAQHEQQLRALAANATGIVAITNKAGYDECHAARMALKNARVAIEKTGKSAREDAQAFAKAVIAEEKRLVALIAPEESRLQALQDDHDAKAEQARAAKAKAEAERAAAVQQRIDWIRGRPVAAVDLHSVGVFGMIETLEDLPMTSFLYDNRVEEAKAVLDEVVAKLRTMHDAKHAHEQQAEALRVAREAFEAQQREARERQEREDRERAERIEREDAERKFAADWDDAHREYRQRIEDAERARVAAAAEAAAAAERAEQQRRDDEARAEQKRKDDEAADARKRAREALERAADPWRALVAIREAVVDAFGPAGPTFESTLQTIDTIAELAMFKRDELAALDRGE